VNTTAQRACLPAGCCFISHSIVLCATRLGSMNKQIPVRAEANPSAGWAETLAQAAWDVASAAGTQCKAVSLDTMHNMFGFTLAARLQVG